MRHEVDDRKSKGKFILNGSANPANNAKLHSGAGRFTVIQMNTMSWQELGCSTGIIKLNELLTGKVNPYFEPAISLELIIERMCIGGWPALIGETKKTH